MSLNSCLSKFLEFLISNGEVAESCLLFVLVFNILQQHCCSQLHETGVALIPVSCLKLYTQRAGFFYTGRKMLFDDRHKGVNYQLTKVITQ